ncbi:hypothetical protein EJ06DRAFT_44420 [Trichodelitschia bisporula]|uniref:Uncharacterized protein n=1 Tax=Trichodelitschia bisporula TaxID=703511 RepID=A0A6G1HW29_9PEZI|nr:hypothetical protein EJ06DRAFT_44420 [Trichodelitschia bisporula]
MIGKLSASWRGDHSSRKDADKSRVGGLVSIDQLESASTSRTSPPVATSGTKIKRQKSPRLSITRRSFTLKPTTSPSSADFPHPASPPSRPTSSHTGLEPPASSPHDRPRTADPSIGRKRSRTAPSPAPRWDAASAPLPSNAALHPPQQSHPSPCSTGVSSVASSSTSTSSSSSEEEDDGGTQRPNTLLPILVPIPSRSPSFASIPKSATPATTSHARSILDEVEGTLSATITELKELQISWHDPGSDEECADDNSSAGGGALRFPDPPRSAAAPFAKDTFFPPDGGYFTPGYAPPAPSPSHRLQRAATAQMPGEEVVSPARMASITKAYEALKVRNHVLGVENDTLKKQMVFARARLVDLEPLREEHDALLPSLQDARGRAEALEREAAALKARSDEAATREADAWVRVREVEGRLEEVNVQKVDLMERGLELSDLVKGLEGQVRRETGRADEAETRAAKAEERAKMLEAAPKPDPTAAAALSAAEARIADLEVRLAQRAPTPEPRPASPSLTQRIEALEAQVASATAAQRIAERERAQLRALLGAECRRRAVEVDGNIHPSAELLAARVDIEHEMGGVRGRAAAQLRAEGEKEGEVGDAERARRLEAEVEYHVQDVVLYKLDVRGYKKDLKRAERRIRELEGKFVEKSGGSATSSREGLREREMEA